MLEPEGLAGIDENYVGLIDPDGLRITKEFPVGAGPSAATEGGGSVWIANAADGTVSRIHRTATRRCGSRSAAPPRQSRSAAGRCGWPTASRRDVVQVDPGANMPVGRITVGNAPRALAVTPGAVWVASGVDGRIRQIDLDSGRPGSPIPVGANPSALAAGAGALWVASEESGTVTRIDPRSGRVVQAIPVGSGPSALAVGEGAVWVVNRQLGTLARIDPERNAVDLERRRRERPDSGGRGRGRGLGGRRRGRDRRPSRPRRPARRRAAEDRQQPGSDRRRGWLGVGRCRRSAGCAPGWDAPRARPELAQAVAPARLAGPAGVYGLGGVQPRSLAYDGLVAYRRVEGAAGATIVGALATTAPPASRDGLSYVFTLRRGLRYSDGTPVRPADFRGSMERFLQATRDLPADQQCRRFTRASSARGDAWPRVVAATCRVASKRTRGRAPSPSI